MVFWVLTEPGIEIDICYNVDLEGMDFKETCVNIDYKVSDNPHDHTEWFERMRKVNISANSSENAHQHVVN